MAKERTRRSKMSEFTELQEDQAETDEGLERLRRIVGDALDRLSARDRSVIFLRFFEGKTFREIGEDLGSSERACRSSYSTVSRSNLSAYLTSASSLRWFSQFSPIDCCPNI